MLVQYERENAFKVILINSDAASEKIKRNLL